MKMRTLIVEDDFTSRIILQEFLQRFGQIHVAVNGNEAVEAIQKGFESDDPYDLVCLDINLPEMNGHDALKKIRSIEKKYLPQVNHPTKIIMTTIENNYENVSKAFNEMCDGYVAKPISLKILRKELHLFKLIPDD